jgi:glucokinase
MAREGDALMSIQLIADIGGTNARFALRSNGVIHDERVLACADYPHITDAVEDYLLRVDASRAKRPREAAFAIACPVIGDVIRMTNFVWEFSASAVRRQLGLERFIVLNDFTALAMAIPHLSSQQLLQVGGGTPVKNAPIALVGPGTGLGVSGLIHSAGDWLPLQGEGGHATFAPATEREVEIVKVLWRQYSHVSAERLLSGPGLVAIYQSLCTLDGLPLEPLSPPEITQYGLDGTRPVCTEVLSIFCAALGTVAADVALTIGALGGVYIGGGIVPKVLDFFKHSGFRLRFESKGRYAEYLAAIPSWVITTETPALIGVSRAFTDPGPRVVA